MRLMVEFAGLDPHVIIVLLMTAYEIHPSLPSFKNIVSSCHVFSYSGCEIHNLQENNPSPFNNGQPIANGGAAEQSPAPIMPWSGGPARDGGNV